MDPTLVEETGTVYLNSSRTDFRIQLGPHRARSTRLLATSSGKRSWLAIVYLKGAACPSAPHPHWPAPLPSLKMKVHSCSNCLSSPALKVASENAVSVVTPPAWM